MLSLHFTGEGHSGLDIGPVDSFQLFGPALVAGDRRLAVQENERWCFSDRTFAVVEALVPVQVRFEDEKDVSVILGPYPQLRISGGGIRSGHGFGEIIASYNDRSHCWYEYLSRRRYCRVVIEEAVTSKTSPLPDTERK